MIALWYHTVLIMLKAEKNCIVLNSHNSMRKVVISQWQYLIIHAFNRLQNKNEQKQKYP